MKKLLLSLLVFTNISFSYSAMDLVTTAEKSNWIKTGNARETARLCQAFQRRFSSQVQCRTYGKTPEGRELHYMLVGDPKTPAVWVQAGIHAGEIDGKDAVFWLLREMLEGKIESPLKGIHLVFIPIVNLDGHERTGKWNRPNQVGPQEMGWRTTAQNFNLNRDFMKTDAPEMVALLKLWHNIDPVISLDLHVTNGAQFQPEVGLIIHPTTHQGSSPLHEAGKAFEMALLEKMKARNHLALPFYPSFEVDDEPSSGFSRYVSQGRFAHGYWYNNNRLGMLVETHSWKDYANRVKTHRDTVLSTLELAKEQAANWKKFEKELDAQKMTGMVDLAYKRTDKNTVIEFAGYKYKISKSDISGDKVIKYDPTVPEVWKVPFYEELVPSISVEAPSEGYYVLPADTDWLLPKLQTHGIKYVKATNSKVQTLKVFRATKTQLTPASFEGHQMMVVEGEWKPEEMRLPKNSYFIPINQPKGRMVLQLFEPLALDSFLAWGFFNRAFERKEYMENYVAEDVAREMLKNPEIEAEFKKKLKEDKEFAKSPEQRFEFFYRKHPSWDERFNKFPVFKK